jgi:hypothetical protein
MPLVLLLLVGVGTGLWIAGAMLFGGVGFSGDFLLLSAILVGGAGYPTYRSVRTLRRLLTRRRLLPLSERELMVEL